MLAVGNPFGLNHTVTSGIISGRRSSLVIAGITYKNLLQTDAPINHGNSGGALVDAYGNLIGINSAGIPDAQNIGFAIAIDSIKPFLQDLEAGRAITKAPTAFMGVSVNQTPNGVAITDVTDGSGASKAGIEVGDVLKKVGDTSIATVEQLGEVLRTLSPGTNTAVQVLRDGQTIDLTIELGSRTD